MRYELLTSEQERGQLIASGLDEATAGLFSRSFAEIGDGAMSFTNGDLARLIGHPTQPLIETLRTWL